MKIRKFLAAVTALTMAAAMVSCSGNSDELKAGLNENSEATSENGTAVSETAKEEVTEVTEVTEPDPSSLVHNPLTGEYGYNPEAVGKRPVAVMINNIDQSLPQYGIGSADYIYEIVVEGGITRLMAVFGDYTSVPTLCSIRSCRYYYPIIANGLDAIYCHWGMDMTIAKETLERLGIDRFDGDSSGSGMFYNDENRLEYYAREHTGCLDGSQLPANIENAGFRTEAKNGGADYMKFADSAELTDISDESCESLEVYFSDSYFSTFTYDKESKKYLKQHSGSPHIDASTGEQLAFTNVFALKTDVSLRDDGYRMDVALSGGEGYYFSGGKVKKINWSKADDNSNIRFTDSETGEELTVNRGKCYIALTRSVSY
jgi:hypothetical protein